MKKSILSTAVLLTLVLGTSALANASVPNGISCPESGWQLGMSTPVIANSSNTVTTGSFQGAYGGFSYGTTSDGWGLEADLKGSTQANSNTLTIQGGSFNGGRFEDLDSRTPLKPVVAAGYANYASDNTLNVQGGTYATGLYGGYALVQGNSAKEHPAIANNKVNVSAGTIDNSIFGAYLSSNKKDGNTNTVKNNAVLVGTTGDKAIAIKGDLYGAYASDRQVKLEGNSVTINRGNILTSNTGNYSDGIFGAYGGSLGSSANNNQVIINGGTITGNISGAYANSNYAGTIENNSVIINGGTISGSVFAAQEQSSPTSYKNNQILINGPDANLAEASLYGSNVGNAVTEDYASGNALIINNWSGKVANLKNFNTIKFQNIPWENGGTVVEISDGFYSDLYYTQVDLRDSLSLAGGTKLKANDSMYFIKTEENIYTQAENVLTNPNGNAFQAGVAFEGTGQVEVDELGNVKYTILTTGMNQQMDIINQNSAIAAAFLTNGGDLVTEGLQALQTDPENGTKTFAIVEGVADKYDVAKDLKVNGWNGIYGIGDVREYPHSSLSYAAFFENGIANYRTFNFSKEKLFRGDGSLLYNGGGVAARFADQSGVYVEGSYRLGQLKNDMDNVLIDGSDVIHGYQTKTDYYGFHLGLGKSINLAEDRVMDVYSRYFYTHNDGDAFVVAEDEFLLEDLTSEILRVGLRYQVNQNKPWSTYYGLAWEHEFDGRATGTVNGTALPADELEGNSYFAELGCTYQAQPQEPWNLALRLRGYGGQREGFSGMLRATYSF